MRIQIGTYPNTSITFTNGTKSLQISGLAGLLTSKKRIKNLYIIRGSLSIPVLSPSVKNYTLTENSGVYTLDYSALTSANTLLTGDEVVCEVEIPDNDLAILSGIATLQGSILLNEDIYNSTLTSQGVFIFTAKVS